MTQNYLSRDYCRSPAAHGCAISYFVLPTSTSLTFSTSGSFITTLSSSAAAACCLLFFFCFLESLEKTPKQKQVRVKIQEMQYMCMYDWVGTCLFKSQMYKDKFLNEVVSSFQTRHVRQSETYYSRQWTMPTFVLHGVDLRYSMSEPSFSEITHTLLIKIPNTIWLLKVISKREEFSEGNLCKNYVIEKSYINALY